MPASKYLFTVLLISTLSSGGLSQARDNCEPCKLFDQALSLTKNHLYDEARHLYLQAAFQDSIIARNAFYNIACTYALQKDTMQAVDWLRKSISKGYRNLAWAAYDDEDFKDIRNLPEFQQVLNNGREQIKRNIFAIFPRVGELTVDSCLQMAAFLINLNDFERAIPFFEKAWKSREEYVLIEFCRRRGLPCLRKEPHLRGFLDSMATKISSGYLAVEMAKYYILAGENEKAFILLERAIQISPDLDSRELIGFRSELDSIRSDKRYTALIEKLAENYRDKVFTSFDEGYKFPDAVHKFDLSLGSKNELPNDIILFKNLEELTITYPRGGSISSSIGQLRKLKKLTFFHTRYENIPASLFQLLALEYVEIRGHRVKTLPDSVFCLPKLKIFILADGSIEHITINIGSLVSLEHLSLSNNYITDLPGQLRQLRGLRRLNISDNCFSIVPEALEHLDSLQVLDLSLNRLETVPSWLGKLESLDTLDLSFNSIKDFPVDSFQYSKIKYINLYGNKIEPELIKKIKRKLPNCKIISDQQNIFKPIEPKKWKTYRSDKYKFEFQYPSFLSVSETMSEVDGAEFSISVSIANKSSKEQAESKTYSKEIEITITIGHFGFYQAMKNGFESDPELKNNNAFISKKERWYSLSREGMRENAKPIIYSNWRGLFRNNKENNYRPGYRIGLDNFYHAIVIQKTQFGRSISIEYFDSSKKSNNIFEMILTSFKISY